MDKLLTFANVGLLHASLFSKIIYTLVVTHITIAAVTIYLHRCQAHRALDLHPSISHFFRFWLWLTSGMVTKEWAAIHRKHHAKCETIDDPHSPQTRGLRKVFLEGSELYRAESKVKSTLDRYGQGTPSDWIERNIYTRHSWKGVVLMAIVNIFLFGVSGLTVWAVQMIWIPVMAAGIINGVGHFWGYRNFESPDSARNIFPLGILIGGEELHNNHHTYGSSAKLSSKWYEFDIGWFYIRSMELVGLAKVKKVAPRPRLKSHAAAIDTNTLESIVNNRFEVLAKYKNMFAKIATFEIKKLHQNGELQSSSMLSFPALIKKVSVFKPDLPFVALLCEKSTTIAQLTKMHDDLTSIWTNTNDNKDALLSKLQNWCVQAENSGIETLVRFSVMLRRYG